MSRNKSDQLLILRLKGGLGNQLFQIAYLYSFLEESIIIDYKIDCTYYADTLPEVVFYLNEQRHSINNKWLSFYIRNTCRVLGSSFFLVITPKNHLFCLKFIKVRYFDGYWQDFSWANNAKSRLIAICNSIVSKPSVQRCIENSLQINPEAICIHVRMGDYLLSSNLKRYRRLTSTYYQLSVEKALSRGASPIIYLFSDNPENARDLVIEPLADLITINIVEMNDHTAFETIAWMSMFKYIVTANSTFSAWAAWFSQAENRATYISSPSRWFNVSYVHLEPNLPMSWHRL